MERRQGMPVEVLGHITFVILTIWGIAYGISWLIELIKN
jgi:preprotein translocase subunit SecE